jgi:hypothetical protein
VLRRDRNSLWRPQEDDLWPPRATAYLHDNRLRCRYRRRNGRCLRGAEENDLRRAAPGNTRLDDNYRGRLRARQCCLWGAEENDLRRAAPSNPRLYNNYRERLRARRRRRYNRRP